MAPIRLNKCFRIVLADARDLEAVFARVEALAPFGFAKKSLLGETSAGNRQVIGGREGKVVGHRNAEAEFGLGLQAGQQKTALALDRRVRDLEAWQVGDGEAEELEARLLEAHRLGLAIPDDLLRLDAP